MHSSKIVEFFFLLLRAAITDIPVEIPEDIDQYLNDIMPLARAQDVYQLIYHEIKKNHKSMPPGAEIHAIGEVYRYTQNEFTFNTAKQVLDAAGIPYVPLKGAVIKDIYPAQWMRSSCDLDILVKEKDLEKAVSALVARGFTTDYKREYHDVSLYYSRAHLELHYSICENIPRIDRTLSRVWDHVEQLSEFEFREKPAFFAFHIIAHMLYHFLRGGCNVKQFVDFWLLRQNKTYEEKDILPYLRHSKLEHYYKVICNTVDVWFGGKPATELTERIKSEVLCGGLDRKKDFSDVISIFMSGGILPYLISSTFIPLREMRWYYPVLRKHPLLLPLYYCKRIYSKVLGGNKRAGNLVRIDFKEENEEQTDIILLLEEMGL